MTLTAMLLDNEMALPNAIGAKDGTFKCYWCMVQEIPFSSTTMGSNLSKKSHLKIASFFGTNSVICPDFFSCSKHKRKVEEYTSRGSFFAR